MKLIRFNINQEQFDINHNQQSQKDVIFIKMTCFNDVLKDMIHFRNFIALEPALIIEISNPVLCLHLWYQK